MQFEPEEISEFAKLWEAEFQEKLSPEQARHQASLLLELYTLLYGPTPEEQSACGACSPPQHP